VERVWVVDTPAQAITIFRRDRLPQTVGREGSIDDSLLPGFELLVSQVFGKVAS
jgi:Uma2 family endonuclease